MDDFVLRVDHYAGRELSVVFTGTCVYFYLGHCTRLHLWGLWGIPRKELRSRDGDCSANSAALAKVMLSAAIDYRSEKTMVPSEWAAVPDSGVKTLGMSDQSCCVHCRRSQL
jgi:hypothetical protein